MGVAGEKEKRGRKRCFGLSVGGVSVRKVPSPRRSPVDSEDLTTVFICRECSSHIRFAKNSFGGCFSASLSGSSGGFENQKACCLRVVQKGQGPGGSAIEPALGPRPHRASLCSSASASETTGIGGGRNFSRGRMQAQSSDAPCSAHRTVLLIRYISTKRMFWGRSLNFP
jgi:hypothetical protein